MDSVKTFFHTELVVRQKMNPKYSLRCFARDLQISRSHLSQILNGKSGLGPKMIQHIKSRLQLDDTEVYQLNLLSIRDFSRNQEKRDFAKNKILELQNKRPYKILPNEYFQVISKPQHFIVLAAMELDNYDGTLDCLEKILPWSRAEIGSTLQRLQSLDLVELKNSFWELKEQNITTQDEIPQRALRQSHKESLQQVISNIDQVDISKRSVTSITMAIDNKKLPEAKKLIQKFRHDLSDFLESGQKNQVYNLNIQLMPQTSLEEKK